MEEKKDSDIELIRNCFRMKLSVYEQIISSGGQDLLASLETKISDGLCIKFSIIMPYVVSRKIKSQIYEGNQDSTLKINYRKTDGIADGYYFCLEIVDGYSDMPLDMSLSIPTRNEIISSFTLGLPFYFGNNDRERSTTSKTPFIVLWSLIPEAVNYEHMMYQALIKLGTPESDALDMHIKTKDDLIDNIVKISNQFS